MPGGKFSAAGIIIAVTAAITGITTPFAPASASTTVTAPFTWEGASWCPNYYASNDGGTCDATEQSGTGSSAEFNPSQVVYSGSSSPIYLEMNRGATETGAFNTQTQETWSAPATLSEQIDLPCTRSGEVENWPAFWLVTTGSWPAGGEIDVMEGLNGTVQWHYHYLSASNVSSSVGGGESGFTGCGTHTYAVDWTTSEITIYYDGTAVGTVTPAEIGVPIASGPMFVVNDYATSSTYGGPTVGNVKMEILQFSGSSLSAGPDQSASGQSGSSQSGSSQSGSSQSGSSQSGSSSPSWEGAAGFGPAFWQ